MNKRTGNDYRYPGSRPFYDNENDRRLFFGRDREKNKLLHKILADNLLVLYARSGLGKTSLIEAGLSQPMRNKGLVPLKIRFNDPDLDPLDAVYQRIGEIARQKSLDYESGEKDSLWQYFKTACFWAADDSLLTPVLILDQFEEFFVYHSPEERERFTRQLADLVNNNMPRELRRRIRQGESPEYTDKPPNVKIIVSIREDYLGRLEEMSPYIPGILHHRFRLLPLGGEQARDAIIKPCQVHDDDLHAVPFHYSPDAVVMILDFLCTRIEKEGIKTTDEVEPFQLQLLCRHIEEKVREKAVKNKKSGDIIVKKDSLGGEAGMQRVLQRFYDDRLDRLGGHRKKKRTRKLCEKGLISAADRRLSLEEDEIIRKFKVTRELLSELVDTRLLRSEPRVGSVYYELSHDTLIAPIMESRRKRKFNRKMMSIFAILAVCFLLSIALVTRNVTLRLNKSLLDKDLELGKRFYDRGQYNGAVDIYKNIIEKGVLNPAVFFEWGRALVAAGDTQAAVETYENALAKNIKNLDIYRMLAILYIKNGQPHKAVELYRQALEDDPAQACIYKEIAAALKKAGAVPYIKEIYDIAYNGRHDDPSCYLDIGNYYTGLKDYDRAGAIFKKAIASASGDMKAEAYLGLGNALCFRGKYSLSIGKFREAIRIRPGCAEAYNSWGNALFYLEKYDEALEKYRQAIERNPDFADAYNGLGNTLKYRNRYGAAIDAYRKAVELDPDNAYAWYGWGNILNYHIRGGAKEAIEKYRKAIALKPDYFYAYYELGAALIEQKRYREAIDIFDNALTIDDTFADVYFHKGLALTRLGKYNDAVKAYRDAIAIKPGLARFHYELGNALFALKRYDEALKEYKKAAAINPKFASAYARQAKVLLELGRKSEADAEMKKTAGMVTGAGDYYSMGSEYLQQEEYEEAAAAFRKTIDLDPGHPGAYKGWGDVQANMGKYIEAVDAYKKAIDLDPDNTAAYEALVEDLGGPKYNRVIKSYQQMIDADPGNLKLKVQNAEFCLLAGRFDSAYKLASEVFAQIEKQNGSDCPMAVNLVYISAALFQRDISRAIARISQFISYYEALPGDYHDRWSYGASKLFLKQEQPLPQQQIHLLLTVIDILELPASQGKMKLTELRTALHDIIRTAN